MSVVLRGINLPEEGKTITIDIDSSGVAYLSKQGEWEKHETIQLPKHHGRLKDESCIIQKLEELEEEPLYQHDTDDWWVGIISAEDVVYASPTVVEAESEG